MVSTVTSALVLVARDKAVMRLIPTGAIRAPTQSEHGASISSTLLLAVTMPLPASSLPRGCVYDIPMALDSTLSRVKGLEPGGAPSRNRRHVEDSRQWTVGPMPVEEFLEYFLPLDEVPSMGRLASYRAFNSIPPRADTPDDLYEPLVRKILLIACASDSRLADQST